MKVEESGVEPLGMCGEGGQPIWKRVLDLTLIGLLSPGLLLLGAVVIALIKVGSNGPVLFRQKRVGYRGREFVCFKFRTMRVDAESDSHRRHTQELIRSQSPMVKLDARRDPRLIPFGSILRVSGLDELPQLLNVVRGEMSLVGPRPCIPYECEAYEPWHWQRFNAAPGLTGLWQVSGKNRTTFDQMVRLDIEYSQRRSLWMDLAIMLKTVPALWGQYCDMRQAKGQRAVGVKSANREASVESFSV
jgi:lipopolysaccharide/colanic/teichoic acid biosynthesis glycosyltransferase